METVGDILLKARGLAVGYRSAGRRVSAVLENIDVDLRAGEVVCLLGANGAGKSTLLRTLAREQQPLSGHVMVDGRDIYSLPAVESARMVSVVYTERTHAGALTVDEVVGLGRQPYTGFFGRLSADDRRIVHESMAAVGIATLSGRFMATLSDGERQKVMIARAVAQQTPVMMLDEPTSFLDVASRLEVMGLLSALAADRGKAVLLSTHDVADALSVASRLWLLPGDGSLLCGTVDEMIASRAMERLFEGRGVRFDYSARDYRLK